MKNFKLSLFTGAALLPLLILPSTSYATMSPYVEAALIDICKAARSNKLLRFHQVTKAYNLKHKTIALKVVCNGDDIISYAERYGAHKTAGRLEHSLGRVAIIDVASVNKMSVNFKE